MPHALKLEDRELLTIADLTRDALRKHTDMDGLYQRRSLVRLAIVLDQVGRPRHNRLMVLADAPAWLYRYLAKPVIVIPEPAKPRPKRHARPKPARRPRAMTRREKALVEGTADAH